MQINSKIRVILKSCSLLLNLVILLTVSSAGFASPSGQQTTPSALVRIDLKNQDALNNLAQVGVSTYGQLYLPDGSILVLLPADSELQARLSNLGYTLQVLEPVSSSGAYFLLQGSTEQLNQAAGFATSVLVVGNQMIVRAAPEQGERFAEADLFWRPLNLNRLPETISQKALSAPAAISPSPLVQEMIDQVNSNTLYSLVGGLSGEWAVNVEGIPYTFYTRYSYTDIPIKKATRYVYEFFQSLGLQTGYDYYYLSGLQKRNVIAQQTGVNQPGRIFLLTAHLDSYSNNSDPYLIAPGADDNASGSAAVMHIAQILRNYSFDCTLRYALFTGEEQGMIGSSYYAQDVYQAGENIAGVLNLDMIGFNTPGSYPSIEMHTRPGNAGDLQIANLFSNSISAYSLNLYPYILQDGKSFSDHSSFWNFGYPAILAIEDWTDHTLSYHKSTDLLASLDMGYYTAFTKAALATLAHMGCLLEGQISGQVTDAGSGLPISGATVSANLDAVKSWQTSTLPNGTYQFHLAPGTYTVSASADNHFTQSVSSVVVNTSTVTQNFALQPCSQFTQVGFTFDPVTPAANQTVNFSASAVGSAPNYSWNFGDGSSASGSATSHSFTENRAYPVTLTLTNACSPTSIIHYVPVGLDFYIYLPQFMGHP